MWSLSMAIMPCIMFGNESDSATWGKPHFSSWPIHAAIPASSPWRIQKSSTPLEIFPAALLRIRAWTRGACTCFHLPTGRQSTTWTQAMASQEICFPWGCPCFSSCHCIMQWMHRMLLLMCGFLCLTLTHLVNHKTLLIQVPKHNTKSVHFSSSLLHLI